jgi:hypothetical protein
MVLAGGIACVGAMLFLSMALQADPALPPLTAAGGLGLNIHFTDPKPGELEMIAAAGFKWVRMDLTWAKTEKKKGVYDFSAYDRLLAALDAQKMHAILILNYGNPLYAAPGEKWPFVSRVGTEEFRSEFATWAAAAVKHFEGRGCIWEVWNEPNYKLFWAPAPDVHEYVELARATAEAVHEAAPEEPLIGPACSSMDFKFLEACFQGGLLEDWSAVSVHPYRRSQPGTVAADYQRLRDLIAKYAPSGKAIPIICSEWGYSTSWAGFDDQKEANYLIREFGVNIANGIPITIWYDWRDDGAAADDPENRFGIVHHDYQADGNPVYDPKLAYNAMKAFAAGLGGKPGP